jgi:glutaredoxin
VKEFLSRAGQAFAVKLVDEDSGAYDELIALGYRTVPVTIINGQVVRGFDPAALGALTARNLDK